MLEYPGLLQEMVYSISKTDKHSQILATLKELYREEINSVRRFELINTIGQLFHVLELRDVLSEDNVAPLKDIARKLPDSQELMRKIKEYDEGRVRRENGHYYDAESITLRNTSIETPIYSHPIANISANKKQRLHNTIVEEIGTHWRDLARYLKIREITIQDIDSENTSLVKKASRLLEVYEAKADPQKWFFVLCDALDKSRRSDLSRSLRDIMSMNI